MSLSIDEYLLQKGVIELYCEIHPLHGAQFEELLDPLPISRPTLTKRLDEGIELNLLDQEAVSGERGTTHKYVLTQKGMTLRELMKDFDVVAQYKRLKAAREQFESTSQEFQERISDNIDILNDDEVQRNTSHKHKSRYTGPRERGSDEG